MEVRLAKSAGFCFGEDNSKSNALVLGLGSIGLITVQALKAFGVNAFGFDVNLERQKFASKFDVEYKKDIYDCIFMTSGSSKAIPTALEHVRNGGKIIVFSSIENDEGYKNNDIYNHYYKTFPIFIFVTPVGYDPTTPALEVMERFELLNTCTITLFFSVNNSVESAVLYRLSYEVNPDLHNLY